MTSLLEFILQGSMWHAFASILIFTYVILLIYIVLKTLLDGFLTFLIEKEKTKYPTSNNFPPERSN